MARSTLPYAPLRVAALGPQYMRAVALLSPSVTEGEGSELSWPDTESSIEFTDLSMTDLEFERIDEPFRPFP